MKKIALIGNSHTAMIKQAWDEVQDVNYEFKLSFFVWRSDGINSLKIRKNDNTAIIDEIKILEKEDNEFDLDSFDAIILCGLGFELKDILNIYNSHRTLEQTEGAFLISNDCYKAAIKGAANATIAMKVVKAIKDISNFEKIILIPTPRGSEHHLDETEGNNVYKKCVKNQDQEEVIGGFLYYTEVFKDLGIEVLDQPKETIESLICTKKSYSNASDPVLNEKYFNKKGRRDLIHMNTSYGKLLLSNIEELISTL